MSKDVQADFCQRNLLTVAQVASELNISVRTVRRLIASGSLPVHRIGRSVRVSPSSLSAFLTGAAV